MNASITGIAIRRQLAAMDCDYFDVGILQRSGRMLLREGWAATQLEGAIGWLKHENARGAHVFVRPHGAHGLSLVDDLTFAAIAKMKQRGFEPALIIETSVNNFQAWLKHGRILDHALSTQAAKELARRFGGDPSSADWRHFGRIAGFTNQKPGRRLASGLPPYVKLHEYSGRSYTRAREFLEQMMSEMKTLAAHRRGYQADRSQTGPMLNRSLADFQRDARYSGDLHRADMAWALYAARHGLPQSEIEKELLNARDLSKKGGGRRQIEYVRRTANKAVTTARADCYYVKQSAI